MSVHVYTANQQPATRYTVDLLGDGKPIACIHSPNQPIWAACCRRRRVARNLVVQVYYDMHRFSCVPGKGCKATR